MKNQYLEDGFALKISFQDEPYFLEGENKNIINFFSTIDESKAGSPMLPSKTIFIAIPPESKIKVSLIEEKTNLINNVLPKANPQISLRNDSTLNYSEGSLNLSIKAELNFIRRKNL